MIGGRGAQIAPFLKFSFSKISFLSIKWCILLVERYGKRGGVLRPERGLETTPWHSQGLRERSGLLVVPPNEGDDEAVLTGWNL